MRKIDKYSELRKNTAQKDPTFVATEQTSYQTGCGFLNSPIVSQPLADSDMLLTMKLLSLICGSGVRILLLFNRIAQWVEQQENAGSNPAINSKG
ncbi:hypothetical protein DUE52_12720 [Larkinella punicea]|uniref:Uncharacterized protein n=1 Tax=Larkinella punicea TaxID=2315727 RepID=A0A368JNG9_9BACT|nr:hypothetical protein DUE52_12720 [Larkinella punicea]